MFRPLGFRHPLRGPRFLLGALLLVLVQLSTESLDSIPEPPMTEEERADMEAYSRISSRLAGYGASASYSSELAFTLIREARDNNLSPDLLLGVLLVENPWLKADTVNWVGATGLMQVMPVHAGGWGCGSSDLTDVDANICHGARILAHYLNVTGGDLDRALLRYNGCVHGTNTPNCHTYPQHVYARGRIDEVALASYGE